MTGAGGGGRGAGVSTAPTPAERGALPTRLSRPLPHGLGATRYGQPRAQDSVYEAPTLTFEVSNGTDRQRAGPKPAGRGVDGRRPLCGRLLPQPWRSPRRTKGEDLAARLPPAGRLRRRAPLTPASCRQGGGAHCRARTRWPRGGVTRRRHDEKPFCGQGGAGSCVRGPLPPPGLPRCSPGWRSDTLPLKPGRPCPSPLACPAVTPS